MSEQHGPAHRGGTLGKPGIDWCYVTPGELKQARKDAAAVQAVREIVRDMAAQIPVAFDSEAVVAALAAALGGDPE